MCCGISAGFDYRFLPLIHRAVGDFTIYEYKVKKEFENEPMLVIRLKNKTKDGFEPDRKIIDEEVKNLLTNEHDAIL